MQRAAAADSGSWELQYGTVGAPVWYFTVGCGICSPGIGVGIGDEADLLLLVEEVEGFLLTKLEDLEDHLHGRAGLEEALREVALHAVGRVRLACARLPE